MKNVILVLAAIILSVFSACNQKDVSVNPDYIQQTREQSVTEAETSDVLNPVINTITGYSDGAGVTNGKWGGQPPVCANVLNRFAGYYVADCYNYGGAANNPYYWDINGSNFGTAQGSVSVTGVNLSIVSWTNSKIRIKPYAAYSITPVTGVTIKVIKPSNGGTGLYSLPKGIIPILKSRGYGQCTYEVALRRIAAGKVVPPLAYSSTGDVNSVYIPAKWDVLHWDLNGNGSADDHTGIITSGITISGSGTNKTYSFDLTERNATCNELLVTVKRCNFKPYYNTGIYSNASSTRQAKKYYRNG